MTVQQRLRRTLLATLMAMSLSLSGATAATAQTAGDEVYQVWPDADYCFALLVGQLPPAGEETPDALVAALTGEDAVARCVETVSVLAAEQVYPEALYRERGLDPDGSSTASPIPSSARPARPTPLESERFVERYCLALNADLKAERAWEKASRKAWRAGATVAQKQAERRTWKRFLDTGRTRERIEGELVDSGLTRSGRPERACEQSADEPA